MKINIWSDVRCPFCYIGKRKFEKALEKFLEQQKNSPRKDTTPLLETAAQSPAQNERVVVKIGGKIKIIPIGEIQFLEAADDYVNIHTAEGAFLKNKTMNYFEQLLNPQSFVRVHRSYMVNIQQITRIDPYEKESHLAVLKSGKQIPVSKAGYSKLRIVLGL